MSRASNNPDSFELSDVAPNLGSLLSRLSGSYSLIATMMWKREKLVSSAT
jgi:hypothetical protein